MSEGLMCVGGPYDGRFYIAEHGKRLRLYAPIEFATKQRPILAGDTIEVSTVDYVRDGIRTRDGEVQFWRLEEMSPLEAIRTLVQGYKPHPNTEESKR